MTWQLAFRPGLCVFNGKFRAPHCCNVEKHLTSYANTSRIQLVAKLRHLTFYEADVFQSQGALPVSETQVLGEGVQELHFVSKLCLRVEVGHPQTGCVLRDVADLNLQGGKTIVNESETYAKNLDCGKMRAH